MSIPNTVSDLCSAQPYRWPPNITHKYNIMKMLASQHNNKDKRDTQHT